MTEPGKRLRAAKIRRILMYPLAFAIVAGLWEAYKAIGPKRGGDVLGVRLLARTDDRSMPHVWQMFQRLSKPEVRGGQQTVARVVADATWYSFRVALVAFVVGTLLGLALAVVMARFKWAERALMPYLAVSQTVPIIVLAPLLVTLLTYAHKSWGEQRWLAAALLGVFLAFFPVAVSTLRGLQSVQPAQLELMDSYAAGWWKTLFKLRFPSAVPYIAPALRLAGAAAVVGVVVAEISIGLRFGVGRLVLSYGQEATTDPPKLFTAVFGAAVLGLIMALLIVAIDKLMMRNRPAENT
ncbi:MAG TPA: ABC transporter permease subunit [Ilumatobacteraceae bacterium]|nr:ABC transporter permease subunit [Ilumatobacteraceae bacterium]